MRRMPLMMMRDLLLGREQLYLLTTTLLLVMGLKTLMKKKDLLLGRKRRFLLMRTLLLVMRPMTLRRMEGLLCWHVDDAACPR